MMKTLFQTSILLLLCLICSGTLRAQDQHWQCDPYAWQYDMTAYVTLSLNGNPVSSLSDFEIAAFCGDECRGVASIQTAGEGSETTTYGYLRIRSNNASGETITFKCYDKTKEREYDIESVNVPFINNGVNGLPSAPFVLPFISITPGDADGDGEVTIFDAVAIVNYYLNGDEGGFNLKAADFNGDDEVDIFDATAIVEYYLNQ